MELDFQVGKADKYMKGNLELKQTKICKMCSCCFPSFRPSSPSLLFLSSFMEMQVPSTGLPAGVPKCATLNSSKRKTSSVVPQLMWKQGFRLSVLPLPKAPVLSLGDLVKCCYVWSFSRTSCNLFSRRSNLARFSCSSLLSGTSCKALS